MTMPIPCFEGEVPGFDETEPFPFQEARGKLLDAFCELEISVGRWLHHLGSPLVKGQAFSGRLTDLASHKDLAANAGKNQLAKIKSLPSTCAKYVEIRNALVHGKRTFCTVGDENCVMIRNISDFLVDRPQFIVLTHHELREIGAELSKLAGHLNHWLRHKLNPASSPRPPSTDAADDP